MSGAAASAAGAVGRGAAVLLRRVLVYPAIALGTIGATVAEVRKSLPDVNLGAGLGQIADGGECGGRMDGCSLAPGLRTYAICRGDVVSPCPLAVRFRTL